MINNRIMFYVKWLNFPYEESTWEPLEHLKDRETGECVALAAWRSKQARLQKRYTPYY